MPLLALPWRTSCEVPWCHFCAVVVASIMLASGYRLIFGFSLTGVIFLGAVGNMLLNDTPYIRVSSHAKYDKPGLGRVAVEAAVMYFFLMCISGLAWYRRARYPCPPPSRVVARPNTPSLHASSFHRPSGSFI